MDYEIIIRFLLAALWGGLVGAEREYRSKSAGFRTMIMISVGSCFFTIMSIHIGAGGSTDRIASNIVTGIGFLGAGVIFRSDVRVTGLPLPPPSGPWPQWVWALGRAIMP